MHREQGVELGSDRLVDGATTTCEPCVVHDDVDAAERVDRRPDRGGTTRERRDVGRVGDRHATGLLDLGDDRLGRAAVGTTTVEVGAEVVDHHPHAVSRERECVRATEPPTGTRDQRHPRRHRGLRA